MNERFRATCEQEIRPGRKRKNGIPRREYGGSFYISSQLFRLEAIESYGQASVAFAMALRIKARRTDKILLKLAQEEL